MHPTSGKGKPVRIFVEPSEAQLGFGQTLRLTPILTDINGVVQLSVHPFTFKSSNQAFLTVNADGLCTATTDAAVTPGTVEVMVDYPYANRSYGDTMHATAAVYISRSATKIQSGGM